MTKDRTPHVDLSGAYGLRSQVLFTPVQPSIHSSTSAPRTSKLRSPVGIGTDEAGIWKVSFARIRRRRFLEDVEWCSRVIEIKTAELSMCQFQMDLFSQPSLRANAIQNTAWLVA